MIAFLPYEDGDIDRLQLQPSQADELQDRAWFDMALDAGPVWTMILPDRSVIWIGGFWVHEGQDRATIWCLMAADKRNHLVQITRICRNVISEARWHRIDMAVDLSDPSAPRWAACLGFEREGRLPDSGHDIYVYRREAAHG